MLAGIAFLVFVAVICSVAQFLMDPGPLAMIASIATVSALAVMVFLP